MTNEQQDYWEIPDDIDTTDFDFEWRPNKYDPPYVHQFGTQWQKTGGPRYVAANADGVKYHDVQHVKNNAVDMTRWIVPDNLDVTLFDFTWHPDATEPPMIYQFATQLGQDRGPRYVVPGATDIKHETCQSAISLPEMNLWEIPENIDDSNFDYNWKPDEYEPPFIHQFGTQHSRTGGPRYVAPGATEVKYQTVHTVTALTDKTNWIIPENIDDSNFDYSWHPDSSERPYIYQFGTQHSRTGGPQYVVPGAKRPKFVDTQQVTKLPDRSMWIIPENIDDSNFDYSWHPDSSEQAYIYEFGTQHQRTGGPRYIVSEATQTKFVDTQQVTKLPDLSRWIIPNAIDSQSFDYSWHPDATEPPYIYQFATQWRDTDGPQYVVENATEIKFETSQHSTKLADMSRWTIPSNIDTGNFDFSWTPDPHEQPLIHKFGTQHGNSGGATYTAPGATEFKFETFYVFTAVADMNLWTVPDKVDVSDFDFSWHPEDTEPPYIHQFGTQRGPDDGPRYTVSGASEFKYQSVQRATRVSSIGQWYIPDNIDTDTFDLTWMPDEQELPFIHHFGTQHQKSGGPIWTSKGAVTDKFETSQQALAVVDMKNWSIPENIDVSDFDFSWHPDTTEQPYIYHFGTQHSRSGGPVYTVPGAIDIKFEGGQIAMALVTTGNWSIPDDVDVSDFDFSWHPDTTERSYIYEFGTQHQRTGGPRYVMKGARRVKYVSTQTAKRLPDMLPWVTPDDVDTTNFDYGWHPDSTAPPYIYQFGTQHQRTGGPRYVMENATEVKYESSIHAIALVDMTPWTTPENVDVTNFDYSWHPEELDKAYIYEFGTQHQKTGGPTYTVSGATSIKYERSQWAIAPIDMTNWVVQSDIQDIDFDFSWHPEDRDLGYNYVFGNQFRTAAESYSVVYQVATNGPNTFMDYPTAIVKYQPLDIVFVSNGEQGAEQRYEHLCRVANRPVLRVEGIDGREVALRHAAEISTTAWFIVVPAKLLVDANFDFDFQPSRYIEPKHYIFHAVNPVNGLEYGHQAAVCYNRQLVLETTDYGLDFTMSKLHDVVPVISGVAEYNSTATMTWRTAFREAIKLELAARSGDKESLRRLQTWRTVAYGDFKEWSIRGALDGIEYYESVSGEHTALMLSFSWSWLDTYFKSLYSVESATDLFIQNA